MASTFSMPEVLEAVFPFLLSLAAFLPIPFAVTVTYCLAAAVYVALACAILLIALFLSVGARTRPAARWLAGGVLGSVPFALFFQGLSLPVLVAIAFVPLLVAPWSQPGEAPLVIVELIELALMATIFVAASVTGLIAGWGIGAQVARGASRGEALRASRAMRTLSSILGWLSPFRRRISPERAIVIGVTISIIGLGAISLCRYAYLEAYGSDEMDYRGEKIHLSKKYVDYDDYKNDPDNIATSEIPRVEKMMTEARVGPDFADWGAFVDQISVIKFPGYGMGSGPKVAGTGREFLVQTIEIPRVGKERYFILEKLPGGKLKLVDDFVHAQDPHSPAYWGVQSINLVGDTLIYTDRNSKKVRETNLNQVN